MWSLSFVVLLAAAPAPGAIRYLALGDSFTAGTGAEKDEDYPTRLGKRWKKGGREVAVANVAVNGFTSAQVLTREVKALETFAPTHITLLVGANDIFHAVPLETYQANVREIFDTLKGKGVPASRICVIPQPEWSAAPVTARFAKPAEVQSKIARWNLELRKITETHGACWLDLTPLMHKQANAARWSKDGLHPPGDVYGEWSDAIAEKNPWGLR
jgi:lysophospholipase L1-like esterase